MKRPTQRRFQPDHSCVRGARAGLFPELLLARSLPPFNVAKFLDAFRTVRRVDQVKVGAVVKGLEDS